MKKLIMVFMAALSCYTAFAQIKTSNADRLYWNGFIDYVAFKGYSGSADLNRRDLDIAHKLFDEYNQINGRSVNYTEFVTQVQADMARYRTEALKQIRISKIKHAQNPSFAVMFDGPDEDFMKGLSSVDGFAGAKTTSWKFPKDMVLSNSRTRPNDIYYADAH